MRAKRRPEGRPRRPAQTFAAGHSLKSNTMSINIKYKLKKNLKKYQSFIKGLKCIGNICSTTLL